MSLEVATFYTTRQTTADYETVRLFYTMNYGILCGNLETRLQEIKN